MKKRILATIGALVILLGAGLVVPAKADAATTNYRVGYSKHEITPWVNPTDHSLGLLQLSLAGTTTSMSRLSTGIIDDNGDGVIGDGDGLYVTCIAITDGNGESVLLYSADLLNGNETLVNTVRTRVMSAMEQRDIPMSPEKRIPLCLMCLQKDSRNPHFLALQEFLTNLPICRQTTESK